jgi:hypothetical protein
MQTAYDIAEVRDREGDIKVERYVQGGTSRASDDLPVKH